MTEGIADLATSRRARLWATIHRLEDARLHAHVEESYKSIEPNIEEWHDFVEGVELLMKIA